jgi:hypothetical protein
MAEINRQITRPHLQVGPAYFMERPGDGWAGRMADRLVYEIFPLLREYVNEDRAALGGGTKVVINEVEVDLDPKAVKRFREYGADLARKVFGRT